MFAFLVGQVVYIVVGFLFATTVLKIPRSGLPQISKTATLATAALMGAASLVALGLFQNPFLGLPGAFVALLLGNFDKLPKPMILSWIVVAWLVNTGLYYILARGVRYAIAKSAFGAKNGPEETNDHLSI